MNVWLLVSGVVAASIFVGHCTKGRKEFFLPMLAVTFDPPAKRIMEFVWHMATASLVLPPILLIYAGIYGGTTPLDPALTVAVGFVAAQFALWGLVHLLVVSTSGIAGAVYKLFQWMLFLAVATTATAGLFLA